MLLNEAVIYTKLLDELYDRINKIAIHTKLFLSKLF